MIDVPAGGTLTIGAPSLVLLVGPSGSGKSTFAKRIFGPYEVISSDHCRALITDSEEDQSVTPQAFAMVRYIARARLEAGRVAVVDATNVHESARRRNLDLAAKLGVETVAVALDVPLEDCLARNASRKGRVVPERAIRGQRADMDKALTSLDGEGFSRVYRLDVPAMASVELTRAGTKK
ncbi:Predicted kinase [Nocardioides sp. YR527]|uniref:AAA family ATPase n=1 Tax=Nocardioides sp. YR527 TaxID=1881028 RepID=UPI000884A7B1|nr:AAA family ATPase [Nocardioides sp. YR527]SDJ70129.1 Predicted kinase [Nocardioides sp. YR527]